MNPCPLIRLARIALLCLCTAAAAVPASAAMADVEVSWDAAYVALPADLTGGSPVLGHWRSPAIQEALATLRDDKKTPAVIYLHGCTGFGAEGNAYRHFLSLRGYAFFAPDSLARADRLRNCNPTSHATALRGSATPLRLAELRYALQRIAELPWVDSTRMFLIGFSEGAAAAARYDGDAFVGLILTGWHCHGGPDNHGVALPAPRPYLAIISARDPWYPDLKGRSCALFIEDRTGARGIVLEQETHALLTSSDSEAARLSRQAIAEFLRAAEAAERPRPIQEED